MPIVIQELLSSDTISQAADKINFNFDQLILNGGGPVGPTGPAGPTGPVGGRGLQGATWYKDNTAAPGVNPNTLIIPGLEEEDYYLQSNGQVWQYNGTVWIQTIINLTGPQGPAGLSFGFNYAGGFPGGGSINNQNVAYPVPMPGGAGSGANPATNQGVSTLLVGAVASNAIPPAGIGAFTSAFQLPNTMTQSLDSSILSALIHQKDSSSSAIRFMGGGDNASDKYEQLILGNLSNITLGVDDSFNINVPKAATAPTGISDLVGFNLNTIRKGQQYFSGKHINFISGTDFVPSGFGGEVSDISFILNTSNPTTPAKFSVSTVFASASALLEVGGNITIPTTTIKTGRILGEAAIIGLISPDIILRASINNSVIVRPAGVGINAGTGPINIQTTNSQSIIIASNDELVMSGLTLVSIVSQAVNIGAGVISLGSNSVSGLHSIIIDTLPPTTGGTKIRGNVTWKGDLPSNPFITTHRNISINKENLLPGQSPVFIGRNGLGSGRDLVIEAFKGTPGGLTTLEYNRIFTASTDIRNTSGNAGFVGHTVENTSTDMPKADVGFRLRGRDRISGGGVEDRFNVTEEATAVHNRVQYVRRSLEINPFYAGIVGGSAFGQGFTVPEIFMKATFLDITIGNIAIPFGDNGVSDSNWILFIPNGSYEGQRLIVHIIARGGEVGDDTILSPRAWPAAGGGSIEIQCRQGQAGVNATFQKIGKMVVAGSSGSYTGSEFFIELLWIGRTYTVFNGAPIPAAINRTAGWLVTNGTNKIDADNGEYEAVQNAQTWI